MALSQRARLAASNGTGTQTQLATDSSSRNGPVLRLRGEPRPPRRSIRWAEDVVDNEGLGRKSSKVCCIYHPNRPVGESDESDSSSSSDSDSESDNDKRMETGSGKWNNRKCKHGDHHDAHHQHEHDEHAEINAQGGERGKTRRPSPNAYEKMPKTRLKKGGGSTMTEVVKQ